MYKEIIELIKEWCLKYKLSGSFKYQDSILINAQNNNRYLQFIVDDTSIHNLNITSNIFVSTIDLYILGFPKDDNDILEVQSMCYDAAVRILSKIEQDDRYYNIVKIHDYSIMTVSHFTDDNSSGVKLTIELQLPNPVDYCTLDDNFNDEMIQEASDNDIDLTHIDKESNINELILNPIKLR